MTEELGVPERKVNEGPAESNPQLAAEMSAAIERSTKDLTDRSVRRDSLGPEADAKMAERAREVIDVIHNSPDRLAGDIGKPVDQKTEYDNEKAHLTAIATDDSETVIAKQHAKDVTQGTKLEKAFLNKHMDQKLAAEVYTEDPIGNGPNAVNYRKDMRNELKKPLWRRLTGL